MIGMHDLRFDHLRQIVQTNREVSFLTPSVDSFAEFVASVDAKSEQPTDVPEDVLGGLRQAANLNWRAMYEKVVGIPCLINFHRARLVILIGDAPCHGARFYRPQDHDGRDIPAENFDFYHSGKDPDVCFIIIIIIISTDCSFLLGQ